MSESSSLDFLGEMSRADLYLTLLPLVFIGMYGGSSLVLGSRAMRAGIASIACCLVIADGLFLHPPTE